MESPILIPRPETEEWTLRLVELLQQQLKQKCSKRPFRILDVCSGSGCIGLLLAKELSSSSDFDMRQVKVLAVDVLEQAVALGKKNAARHAIGEDQISFLQADLFDDDFVGAISKHAIRSGESFDGFDLIISNPPYIPRIEYEQLDRSVKNHESYLALLGEAPPPAVEQVRYVAGQERHDGLDFYRRIRSIAPLLLKQDVPDGDKLRSHINVLPRIVLEIGHCQARAVKAIYDEPPTAASDSASNKEPMRGSSNHRIRQSWRSEALPDFNGIDRSIWIYDA